MRTIGNYSIFRSALPTHTQQLGQAPMLKLDDFDNEDVISRMTEDYYQGKFNEEGSFIGHYDDRHLDLSAGPPAPPTRYGLGPPPPPPVGGGSQYGGSQASSYVVDGNDPTTLIAPSRRKIRVPQQQQPIAEANYEPIGEGYQTRSAAGSTEDGLSVDERRSNDGVLRSRPGSVDDCLGYGNQLREFQPIDADVGAVNYVVLDFQDGGNAGANAGDDRRTGSPPAVVYAPFPLRAAGSGGRPSGIYEPDVGGQPEDDRDARGPARYGNIDDIDQYTNQSFQADDDGDQGYVQPYQQTYNQHDDQGYNNQQHNRAFVDYEADMAYIDDGVRSQDGARSQITPSESSV